MATRRVPDDSDFLRAVQGAVPLPARARAAPPRTPRPAPRRRPTDDADVLRALDALASGDVPFDVEDTGEHMEGLARGVDRAHLQKLKRGDYSVQAHLDLHGFTRAEARDAVARFLERSRGESRRCVLIVHGRGLRSPAGPVLKEGLKAWLVRGRLGRAVMAFASARPVDGGAGATYVLLRR
ncbi:MAG: Smr/MutS family protein [Myxococcota bacterium]